MHIYEAIQDLQVLGPVKLFNGNYQGHLLHPSQAGFHGPACLPALQLLSVISSSRDKRSFNWVHSPLLQ